MFSFQDYEEDSSTSDLAEDIDSDFFGEVFLQPSHMLYPSYRTTQKRKYNHDLPPIPRYPLPLIQTRIKTSKYDQPIKIIAYMDTRTTQSIMNPDVLPKECWQPPLSYFYAANGKVFSVDLIT